MLSRRNATRKSLSLTLALCLLFTVVFSSSAYAATTKKIVYDNKVVLFSSDHGSATFTIYATIGETYQYVGGLNTYSNHDCYYHIKNSAPAVTNFWRFSLTPMKHYNSSNKIAKTLDMQFVSSVFEGGLWMFGHTASTQSTTYETGRGYYSAYSFSIAERSGQVLFTKKMIADL